MFKKVGVEKENMCKRNLNCPSTLRIVPAVVAEFVKGSSKPGCSNADVKNLKATTHFPHKGNSKRDQGQDALMVEARMEDKSNQSDLFDTFISFLYWFM